MEVYRLYNNKMEVCKYEDIKGATEATDDGYLLILNKDEFAERSHSFGFQEHAVAEAINPRQYPVLEVYPELIFISANELGWHPKKEDWLVAREINFFLNKNILVVVNHSHNNEVLKATPSFQDMSLTRLLYYFLDKIVEGDKRIITEIERRITDLEDEIISYSGSMNNEGRSGEELAKIPEKDSEKEMGKTSGKAIRKKKKSPRKTKVYRNHMEEIIQHRKRIIFLKRYIEPLDEILEDLSENDIGLLPKEQLGLFKKLSAKASKNMRNLNNLRDYVTQVREAWQAQVDIGLNDIMRVFTVITAIFLPLTLIAGWYGMNFKNMPELSWKLGYPFAFFLSLVVVIFSLWYFKKNKFI